MRLKRLKSRKFLLSILVVVAIIAIAVTVIKRLNSPAQGTVDVSSTIASDNYSAPSMIQYRGKYISFSYPSILSVARSTLSGSYLEVVNLVSNNHSQVNITIGVEPGSLDSYTGITFRKQRPNIYSQTQNLATSESFTSSVNGYEQDEFIEHNSLIASLVLTAPYQGVVGNTFNEISTTLKWN